MKRKKVLSDLTVEEVYELKQKLDKIPLVELPRIYTKLSSWHWAKELGEQPEGFKNGSMDNFDIVEFRYYIHSIERMCGNKALLRYHHKVNLGSTDQMFEDWWDDYQLKELREEIACLENGRQYSHLPLYIPAISMGLASIIITIVQLLK